jgi:hypothetical protein
MSKSKSRGVEVAISYSLRGEEIFKVTKLKYIPEAYREIWKTRPEEVARIVENVTDDPDAGESIPCPGFRAATENALEFLEFFDAEERLEAEETAT